MTELFFVYDNKYYSADTPVISSGNRALRYGDGLFETMKWVKGNLINKDFHFDRLFYGMSSLLFDVPKSFHKVFLENEISRLLVKNNHTEAARVRLMVFRGNGGIFDPENCRPHYIIETWSLSGEVRLNENGLVVDVFPDALKSCDNFANLKSNNYLPYVMAGLYAKKNRLNDCIVLNSHNRVCDTAIANVFLVKNKNIVTPPLSEGCVAGVMRRWMLEKFKLEKYAVIEKPLSTEDLLDADEFFLTNAIYFLRWVKSFRDKKYTNHAAREIYETIIETI